MWTKCSLVDECLGVAHFQAVEEAVSVLYELELYDKLEGELLVTTVEMVRIAKSSF